MDESEHAVERLPGWEALSDHDKAELLKFEHYLRLRREPVQPIEGAYAHVYGEVAFEDEDEKDS
jgi:hypothetical protein